ncbi:NAD(P)H-dependent oxidoreductase [Aeromicrobium panaciterrae]|uniref:NADPH-dependent FMN reductase n=1 Tax=Aeromicrobium panaciterrae TaxID=363861 RepID=UPI0031D69293
MSLDIAVVVGNPKPRGRTWDAAHRIAGHLGEVTTSIDVIDLGAGLLGWGDDGIKDAVARVAASDLAVFASPTYKSAYTGVLKTFLDKFEGGVGLQGVVAVPLQLGGSATHSLSPELHLKPVLVELGATIPAPALYLLDGEAPDPAEQAWVDRWATVVRAAAS